MAENNTSNSDTASSSPAEKEEAIQENTADTVPAEPAPPVAVAAKSSGGSRIAAITLSILSLLAVAALAAVTYLGYKEVELESRYLADKVEALNKALNKAEEQDLRQAERHEDLKKAVDSVPPLIERMDKRYDDLNASIEKVYQDLDPSLDKWVLQEVEQLLLLANHRLSLGGEVSIAKIALQLADDRLQSLSDPGAIATREQIAADLLQLDALEVVDYEGIALQLTGYMNAVETWPLAEDRLPAAPGNQAPVVSDGTSSSEELLAGAEEVWRELRSLVVVQRTDEQQQPLLSPDQRYYLVENLELKLLTARLALLKKDQSVFKQSLTEAIEIIERYYDVEAPAIVASLAQIRALGTRRIVLEMPDISKSLILLQQLKAKRS